MVAQFFLKRFLTDAISKGDCKPYVNVVKHYMQAKIWVKLTIA